MKNHRMKMIMENGDRVYATKRGKIEHVAKKTVDLFRREERYKHWAYTDDYEIFGTRDCLKETLPNRSLVNVVDVVAEHRLTKLDKDARMGFVAYDS